MVLPNRKKGDESPCVKIYCSIFNRPYSWEEGDGGSRVGERVARAPFMVLHQKRASPLMAMLLLILSLFSRCDFSPERTIQIGKISCGKKNPKSPPDKPNAQTV